MKNAKWQCLNSLALKIIVVITMTLDHIGVLLLKYFNNINLGLFNTGYAFRIIGRIALPLVALLFAEAMRHTHDREHYLARLGLMAMMVLVVEIGLTYGINLTIGDNIFLTIIASAAFVYFYEQNGYKKWLCLIPVAYILLSFSADVQAFVDNTNNTFLPQYIKAQYSLYGFILFVGFYFAYYISDARVKKLTDNKRELTELRNFPYYRTFTNLILVAILLVLNVIFWIMQRANFDPYGMSLQSYSLIAIVFVLLYNGKKGYNNKVLQYSFYGYYPIHILIIFLCFYFILGPLH